MSTSNQPPLKGFELIVHIGAGKTGSSSIQRTLGTHPEPLAAQKISYLGLMCEHAPATTASYTWRTAGGWPDFKSLEGEVAKAQMEKVLADAATALLGMGFNRAIWSNESLFSDGRFIVPILKTMHGLGVKVRVVVYIRRHDTWARSAYLQWGIKHKTYSGPVKSFKDWHKTHAVNFSSGLRPWLNHEWIDLSIRNFDTCGDVVLDFLSCCKIDTANIASLRENETPNPVALALWSIYNSQFEPPMLPSELNLTLQRGGLLAQEPVGCDFTALLPTPEDIDTVLKIAAEDREFINQQFRQHGQPDMQTSPPKNKDMDVSQAQINAALLLLVKQQGDKIAWLTRQVKSLNQEKLRP